MIHFPVFEHLQVKNYRLFPGTERDPGLDFAIRPGLSIVAGINGLGKTTLINILFRLVVGPFELPKLDNAARFGSTARVRETPWPARREFFSRRVADKAREATARLTFVIGAQRFCVERSLADCRLLSATVGGHPIVITDGFESAYKDQVVGNAGLGSFVDFLTMVKFLTFFNEERRDILWDDQAQRQFFRILFSSPAISQEWVQHESDIGSADSSARNASAFASRLEKDIATLEEALEKNAGVTAELAAAQKLLDADLERQAELETRAEGLKKQLTSLTRQMERAKLAEDGARRQLEELRYTALGRLFPSLDEAARYIFTHLFADAHCLACGADAKEEIARLEHAIVQGVCAVCGADPSRQERSSISAQVVPVHMVEQKMLDRALEAVANARTEREAATTAEASVRSQLEEFNTELDRVSRSVDKRRLANATLRARLPPDPDQIAGKRKALENARRSQEEYERQRARAERKYQVLLTQTEELFRAAAVRVAHRFQRFATAFLEEKCSLSAIFMQKAGTMLRAFAEGERRILVTSNLTSSVMVPALLGGPTDDPDEIGERWTRVLDLLTVAAPNAAVRKFGPAYRGFLEAGVHGRVA